MSQTTETTRVNLVFKSDQKLADEMIGPVLLPLIKDSGHQVRCMRPEPGGVQFLLDDLILSVTLVRSPSVNVRILAIGPDDGAPGSPMGKERFRLCAAIARHVVTHARPLRIEWRHRGGFYISQSGRVAVVSGMRGTTGSGSRRKAAARAFSLYGPSYSQGGRPTVSPPPCRNRATKRQSWVEKLTQYTLHIPAPGQPVQGGAASGLF